MSKSRKNLWITFIHGGKDPFFFCPSLILRKIKEIRAKVERKSIMSILRDNNFDNKQINVTNGKMYTN